MARSPIKMWIAGGVAAALLVAVVGWVFVVQPQRDNAAQAMSDFAAAQVQAGTLRTSTKSLAAAMAQIDERRASLATKREALPEASSLDSFVSAVSAAAASTGVSVQEVTATQPVDIATALVAAGVIPATTVTTTDTAMTADTPESTDAEPDPAALAAAAASAAAAQTPFFSVPVTLRATGSLAALEDFVKFLQSGQPRAILFTSVQLTPGDGGTDLVGSTVLIAETQVFVNPKAATPVE